MPSDPNQTSPISSQGGDSGGPPDDLVDVVTAPATTRRWVRHVGGVNRVDLDDLNLFRELAPEQRLLMLVLLLALKDRASALDFEPGPFDAPQDEGSGDRAGVAEIGLRVFYVVDNQRIELVPPPPSCKKMLIREIRNIAGLSGWRRRVADIFRRIADAIDGQTPMPHQGQVQLKCGDFQVAVEVLEYGTQHGARLILNLAPQPSPLAERAQAIMKAMFELRKPSTPEA